MYSVCVCVSFVFVANTYMLTIALMIILCTTIILCYFMREKTLHNQLTYPHCVCTVYMCVCICVCLLRAASHFCGHTPLLSMVVTTSIQCHGSLYCYVGGAGMSIPTPT